MKTETSSAYLQDVRRGKFLSEPELVKLMCRAQKGNRPAMEKLVRSHLGLVIGAVKKFRTDGGIDPRVGFDELVQIGNLALFQKAIPRFRFDMKANFVTFAFRVITNALWDHMRYSGCRLRMPVPVDVPHLKQCFRIFFAKAEPMPGEGLDESVEEKDLRILKKTIARGLDFLSARERTVLVLRYGLDGRGVRKKREIAEVIGVKTGSVHDYLYKAYAKIAEQFETVWREDCLAHSNKGVDYVRTAFA